MSRAYAMQVSAESFKEEKRADIEEAIEEEWTWDYSHKNEEGSSTLIYMSGENSLGGGESEDEFSQRVAEAVWKANGKYCLVEVTCTYLENLPYEVYPFGQEEYDAYVKEVKA